jgi:hypothetical protein
MAARRGITIIEVLVVATGVVLLLGLCAISIQILMRLNGDGMARYTAAASLERLARQVRYDAHASETAEIFEEKQAGKPAGLRLVLEPNHVVTYAEGDGGVVRTESRGDKVARHETYALSRGGSARFELREEGSRPMVAMVVTRSTGKSQAEPPRPLEVVALRGKDRRGLSTKQGAKPK